MAEAGVQDRSGTGRAAWADYAAAVLRLADQCAVLSGLAPSPGLAAALRRILSDLPPRDVWRQRSVLCADGAPVEVSLHCGERARAPAFSLDPGLACSPEADGLTRLRDVAAAAQPRLAPALDDVVGRLARVPDAIPRRFWLGLSLDPEPLARLYVDLSDPAAGGAAPRAPWPRLLRAFGALGREVPGGGTLAALAALGHVRMLGLDVASGGVAGCKVSFALALADRPRLAALARSCGWAPAPLLDYVDRLLRRGAAWRDRRCGVAVAFGPDADAAPRSLTFYHTLRSYLGGDATIRAALIGLARTLGWNSRSFAALSSLLQDEREGRAFRLAGLTVGPHGARGLTLYANTGHAPW